MTRSVGFDQSFPPAYGDRGFRPIYHRNAVNHCPGCNGAQWYIGRVSAECAFCGTALPLQEAMTNEARPFRNLGTDFDTGRLRPSLLSS